MSQFPYSPNPTRLKPFFEKIQEVGVPPKVTINYLKSLGFKSPNDRYTIGILKSLGFLDSSGVPTERWKMYRDNTQTRKVMSQAIKESYSALFSTYHDAFHKDNEAIRNFFSTHAEVGKATLGYMVRTFKILCELADFETLVPAAAPSYDKIEKKHVITPDTTSTKGLVVNVNIQLQLPATNDISIYNKLFESLKKHLLS